MLQTDKDGMFVGRWEPLSGFFRRLRHPRSAYRRHRLERGGWEYATEQQMAEETLRQACDPVPPSARYYGGGKSAR